MKRIVGLAIGLTLVPLQLKVGHGVLMRLGEDPNAASHMAWAAPQGDAWNPARRSREMGKDRVLLGNSVTASALDPELLDAVLFTAEGSGPAHWWAAVRHRVPPGVQVVLYTAPASWNETEVTGLRAEMLLADILTGPDDELSGRVLRVPLDPAALERDQARRTLHARVVRASWAPAEAWFGRKVAGEAVEPALERLHEGRPPHARASWVTPAETTTHAAPASIHGTLLPALAKEDVDLVVVFPSRLPDMLGACTKASHFEALADELNALGVPVIDLTHGGGEFRSEHHQTAAGRQHISALLKPELETIQPGETRVVCP